MLTTILSSLSTIEIIAVAAILAMSVGASVAMWVATVATQKD